MDFWSDITINQWMTYICFAIYIAIIISCIYVVLTENRNPIKSLAWVTVLIFLPVVGWIFYLFFGRSLKGMQLISRHKKRKLLNTQTEHCQDISTLDISDHSRQIIKLAHSLCGATLYDHNDIAIYHSGSDKFDMLKEDLRNAQRYIHLQYYIFSNDRIGREIAEILIDKAKQGVNVNVIYDHVGSFSIDSKFFKSLSKAGVNIHPFFRVTFPQLANRINWRNHRKITIIDGKIGYIGGMNIADRYVYGAKIGKIWRDTHIRTTGGIVKALQQSFATDWNFINDILLLDNESDTRRQDTASKLPMQLITSGPTSTWPNIALVFHKAIAGAKKSIYIQTPYFLPTEALMRALLTAALAKVDVRIMIPRKSDSKILNYASFSYIEECLKAGIKIYLYNKGMMHSKNLIIDNEFVSTGSTNFDFRSFEHNFEANLLIYDKETTTRMKETFFEDIKDSVKLSLSAWQQRPKTQSLIESIVRLFAPIL